jgi:hypothetical protein
VQINPRIFGLIIMAPGRWNAVRASVEGFVDGAAAAASLIALLRSKTSLLIAQALRDAES